MFITATADRGGRTGNKGCLLLARTGAAHSPTALEPARVAHTYHFCQLYIPRIRMDAQSVSNH